MGCSRGSRTKRRTNDGKKFGDACCGVLGAENVAIDRLADLLQGRAEQGPSALHFREFVCQVSP